MLDVIKRDDSLYPAAKSPTQEDGLLAPDGTYFPCGFYGHDKCAQRIAGVRVAELIERGWVGISDSRIPRWYLPRSLTQSQINTLYDMYMLNPASLFAESVAPHIGIGRDW